MLPPPFDDGAVFQYQNFMQALNAGKPVGNHNDGLSLYQVLKGILQGVFLVRVNRSTGLIQDDDWSVL